MLTLLLSACLAQPLPRVAVVDVSAPDAIYEDVSRGLADQVVEAVQRAGGEAVRIEESELPEGGCRIGPCLGVLGRSRQAQVVVMLDAREVDKTHSGVALAALASRNGEPIAVKKYVIAGGKLTPTRALEEFVAAVLARAQKMLPRRDAGSAAPLSPAAP